MPAYLQLLYKMLVISTICVLSGCGDGSSDLPGPTTPAFSQIVVFGDSLSDVGAYNVGTVADLGGGKWTVNSSTAKNWTEIVALEYQLPSPCPAQTGLLSIIPGFTGATVNNFSNCRNYAQGGARVSSVFGPLSYAMQQVLVSNSVPVSSNSGALGLMAVPVAKQMAQHLSVVGGAYSGTELVTVLVGANDIFMNLNAVSSAAETSAAIAISSAQFADWTSLPNWTSIQAALSNPGAPNAVLTAQQAALDYMVLAANNLATVIKTQVIAKGANNIVLINVPDISVSPFITSQNSPSATALSRALSQIYNSTLQTALNGTKVVFVDAFTSSQAQFSNPGQYGLTNVKTPACSTTLPANPLQGSSLTCTKASTLTGVDTSAYLFADSVHPTPYGQNLLATLIIQSINAAGIR